MEPTRRLTLPLLGATFVLSGLDALRDPHRPRRPEPAPVDAPLREIGETASAGSDPMGTDPAGTDPAGTERPGPPSARRAWPPPPDVVVRATGVVQIVAGTLLVAGRSRRLAAVALLGTVLPTTTGGHRFWEEEPDEPGSLRRRILVKNLGLVGALLLAALDTGGSPSVAWRAHQRIADLDLPGMVHSVGERAEELAPHPGRAHAAPTPS